MLSDHNIPGNEQEFWHGLNYGFQFGLYNLEKCILSSSVHIFFPQLPSTRIFLHGHERKFYLNSGGKKYISFTLKSITSDF